MHNMVTKSNRISCMSMHKSTQLDWKKKNIIHDDSSQSRAQGSPFLLHHFKDGSRQLDHYPASPAKLAIWPDYID